MKQANDCSKCSPGTALDLQQVVQRGRLITALFGAVIAGVAPQQEPVWVSIFLRVGGTALAAWNLAVFIEEERKGKK